MAVCNPGTAATKNDKYKDLVDDGYLFQPLAFEISTASFFQPQHRNFFEQAL